MAEPRRSAGTDPAARDASELAGARLLIVEARFYEDIADALLAGAKRALSEAGAVFDCVSVPGSLEVAPAIAIALDAGERAGKPYEGVIALGCVIRGETLHFEIVSQESARALQEAGATFERVSVPGSLEVAPAIAIALDAAERSGRPYEGAVALGCVIRGETLHFEIVSQESARALLELSLARRLPIGNGILTVDTDAQAWTRARPEEADKGGDAARAALSLVRLKRRLAAG